MDRDICGKLVERNIVLVGVVFYTSRYLTQRTFWIQDLCNFNEKWYEDTFSIFCLVICVHCTYIMYNISPTRLYGPNTQWFTFFFSSFILKAILIELYEFLWSSNENHVAGVALTFLSLLLTELFKILQIRKK